MLDSVTALAPAKVNLGLQVLPRRPDGYHDIVSIFTTINLCDKITVTKIKQKNTCLVECEGMELPKENTFTLTYEAFCVLTGIEEGVKVFVEKHIPAGGGLGGGSSNASTFLKSLDILFNTRLNLQSFLDISGKVGSDCFFFTYALCLQSEQDGVFRPFTALVEGRGEKVSPIQSRTDLSFLLVFPKVSVSTKEAYSLVDKQINKTLRSKISFEQMYKKPIECWEFKNDFTIPVSSGYNQISTALADLRKSGSDFVDMSGSGSTVFAAFVDKERAINAMNELSSKWQVVLV